MGKKQYQSQSKYAKRGSQPRKKRPQKPNAGTQTPSSAAKQEVSGPSPERQRSAETAPRTRRGETSATYPYIASDLIRTAGIAALAFIILVILYAVW